MKRMESVTPSVRTVAGAACIATILCGQALAGSIAGFIITLGGQPVKMARVLAMARAGSTGTGAPKNSLPSAADGGFSVEGLAAGTYAICVQVPGSLFLDPCRWSATPPTITLSDSQALTGVQIALQQGSMVKVQINDPGGYLQANEGKTPGAHLLVGVWTANGLFYPAAMATRGSSGREYRLVVPYSTPLKLSVYSKVFRISDEKKIPVADFGAGTPFQATTGVSLKTIVFNIDGVSQP